MSLLDEFHLLLQSILLELHVVVHPHLFEVLLVPLLDLLVEFLDGDVRPGVLLDLFLELLRERFVLLHLVGGLLVDEHQLAVLHAQLLLVLFELAQFLL